MIYHKIRCLHTGISVHPKGEDADLWIITLDASVNDEKLDRTKSYKLSEAKSALGKGFIRVHSCPSFSYLIAERLYLLITCELIVARIPL